MKPEAEKQNPGEMTLDEAPLKWILKLASLSESALCGEKQADSAELDQLNALLAGEQDLDVKSLCCIYEVVTKKNPARKGGREDFRARFHIRARLKQKCIVTLEPLETVVEEEFTQTFTTSGSASAQKNGEEGESIDPFVEEPPIKIHKGQIAMGPLVCQYLSMAIDPNPRKDGASFEEHQGGSDDGEGRPVSPFLVLEEYRQKK